MDLGTLLLLALLLTLAYYGVALTRRTLARYAGDLRAALHELKKTKTALTDAGRGLRAAGADARGLRLRAELAEDGRGRAEARAAAAEAQVAALRERVARADERLAALQEAAQDSMLRWERNGRFGGAGERAKARVGGGAGGLEAMRRAPLGTVVGGGVGAAVGASGVLLSEAYLLAQRPDLEETDSEEEVVGGGAEAWRRRRARPPAVTVPPVRRRRTPAASSSPSQSPPPARRRGMVNGVGVGVVPGDLSGDADSEGGGGGGSGLGPGAMERQRAQKGLVGAGMRLRREGMPPSTSESSSLSSLSAGAGVRSGGGGGSVVRGELPPRGVVELAPGRWPRSRSATQGFRALGTGGLLWGDVDS